MLLLGRLPETADSVEWEGWRFEVVDLDGKRVDKVLAQALVPRHAPERTFEPRSRRRSIAGPVPLDPAVHRRRKVQPLADFAIARDVHAVPLTATEFPHAALEFPIVFVETGTPRRRRPRRC